jgi:hypothetical protein
MRFINGQLIFTPEAYHLAKSDSPPRPQNQNKTLYQEFIPQTMSFKTADEQLQNTPVNFQASLHPGFNSGQVLGDQSDASMQTVQGSQVQPARFNGMAVNNMPMNPEAFAPVNRLAHTPSTSLDQNMLQRGAGLSGSQIGNGNDDRPRSMSMGSTLEMVNPLEQALLARFRAQQQAIKASGMDNANQVGMESVAGQASSRVIGSPQFPQGSPPQARLLNQPQMSTRRVSTGSNGSSQMSPPNRPVNMIRRPSHANGTPPQMNCQRTSSNASLINTSGGASSPLRNSIQSPGDSWGSMPQRALQYEGNPGIQKGNMVERPSMTAASPPQKQFGVPTIGRAATPISSPGFVSQTAGHGRNPSLQRGGPSQAGGSFQQVHGNQARTMSKSSFTQQTPPRVATPVFGQSASPGNPGDFPNKMRRKISTTASHPGQRDFNGELDPVLDQDTSGCVGWLPDAQRASVNLQFAQQAQNAAGRLQFKSQAEFAQYVCMMNQRAAMAPGGPQNLTLNNQQTSNPRQPSIHPPQVPVSNSNDLQSSGFDDSVQKVQAMYAAHAQAQMELARNSEMMKSPQQQRSLFSPGHSMAADPAAHLPSFGSPLPSNGTPEDNIFSSDNLSNDLEDFLAKCGASNSNQSGGTNIAGQSSIDFSGISAQDSQPTRSSNLISMSRIPRSVQISNPGLGISVPPKHPSKPPPDVANWQQVSAPPAPNLIGNSLSGYDVGQFPPGFFNEDPPSRQSMVDMLDMDNVDGIGMAYGGGASDVTNDGDISEEWNAIIEKGLNGQETPKRGLEEMLKDQESPLKRKSSSTNLAGVIKKGKFAATAAPAPAASGAEVDVDGEDELAGGGKTLSNRNRKPTKPRAPSKKTAGTGTATKVKSTEKTTGKDGVKKVTSAQRGPGRPRSVNKGEGSGVGARGRGGAAGGARGGGGVGSAAVGRAGSASASASGSGGRSRAVSTEKESATGYTGTANLGAPRPRGGGGRKWDDKWEERCIWGAERDLCDWKIYWRQWWMDGLRSIWLEKWLDG